MLVRGFSMAVDDDDFPVFYLLYVLAAIAIMGFLAVGGFLLFLR